MTHVETPRAGELTLEFEPTLASVAAVATSGTGSCPTS
jgi:hypothetical protein